MKKVLELIRAAQAALKECGATGDRAESIGSHLAACESNTAAEVHGSPEGDAAPSTPSTPGAGRAAGNRLGTLAGLVLAIGALVFGAGTARAETTYQSFGATNQFTSAQGITSFPTNAPGQRTGAGLSVANNEHAMFVFRCAPTSADATNNWTIKLVRGYTSGTTPQLAYDTNVLSSWAASIGGGTNWAFPEWETQPTFTFLAPQVGSNTTVWGTNLDSYLAGASHVGIYSVLNGQSCVVTNADFGLLKKIVPITYK